MEFKILGPFEVLDESGAVSIAGAKERSLLALLLLHGGRVVSTDRLVDSLWGDEPPGTARKSLQVRVAGLRKTLGQDRIVTSPSGYRVSSERPDELDLELFERLAAVGDAESLREALSLWRGPALVDFTREPWAVAPAARLEEVRLTVLEKRVDADLMLGRHAELVGELEELVVAHPLRERFRGQLILSLYRSGRQAEALEAYRASRRMLVDELGIEPGHPLQELERAILRSCRARRATRRGSATGGDPDAASGHRSQACESIGEAAAEPQAPPRTRDRNPRCRLHFFRSRPGRSTFRGRARRRSPADRRELASA